MSRPCRYFGTPGGCRRGNQCNFAHSPPNESAPPPPPASGLSSDSRPTAASPPPPRGVCRFFWEQGRCNREFACRYQHICGVGQDKSLSPPASTPPAAMPSANVLQRVAPFLTQDGLSRIRGNGTDGFFPQDSSSSLSPSEAHNALKRFLMDNFTFRSTFEVYAFLKPLTSATASNANWTQEDGQLLLNTMASQNGILRLIKILHWPQVSAHAASSREVLSFQRGVLPILRYLSSDFVVKSTLVTRANTLFTEVLQNLPHLADAIEKSMELIMTSRSFRDPGLPLNNQLGTQVFASLSRVLEECLVRFKHAISMHPRLVPLVTSLRSWFNQWASAVSASPPTFDDPFHNIVPTVREHLINAIREKVNLLGSIVDREREKEARSAARTNTFTNQNGTSNEGLIAALDSSYDPPGEIRPDGPRHDNDFLDISEIRIIPTHEELMSPIPPFIPASLYDAPHPFPPGSMQRLLDVQFRLLREELTAPLRRAVQLVHADLNAQNRKKTKLDDLLKKGGGKYHGIADNHEALMFNVYTNVTFRSLVPDRRGLSVSLTAQAPPGRARSAQGGARVAYWEGMGSKRLTPGGLIALLWETDNGVSVHLGIVASSPKELTDFVRSDRENIKIRIVFFDRTVELRVLSELSSRQSGVKMLVELPVMFEAIRPFLEALKTVPELIPFPRYLVFRPPEYLKNCTLDPPKYACLPGFSFQLSSLFDRGDVDDLRLNVLDEASIGTARAELRRASRLDPSQADAVIAALTRELVLIQGPPGTGKSYTGVELLRVLIANHVRPILMIAFTNHALDHMLCSVLDAKITNNIVRLGSRSSDERISQYSIENREMVAGQSRLGGQSSTRHRELKFVENEIVELIKNMQKVDLESSQITKYLETSYPEHHHALMSMPPEWIGVVKQLMHDDSEGPWQTQGPKGQVFAEDTSMYAFWKNGRDLDFLEMATSRVASNILQTQNPSHAVAEDSDSEATTDEDSEEEEQDSDDKNSDIYPEKLWQTADFFDPPDAGIESVSQPEAAPAPVVNASVLPPPIAEETPFASYVDDPIGLFVALGEDGIPSVPSGDRELNELRADGQAWRMSRHERQALHQYWIDHARIEMYQNQRDDFERLSKKHAEKVREYNETKEEIRRDLLKNVDIIGCTTTGAAKLGTLLKSLNPKVLLVEEAGQVLEAHVLGSLVPSVEHLILIGDPLQLRPTLNNFSLSMDNSRGAKLYRFDMSLMERLATSGLAMSRIDVQRRMRPEISSLIRNTLYAGLQDHDLVKQYPEVRGLTKNLFFLTHNHAENGGTDEMASKYNMHEVEMIRDLVLYLLRQGCYSAEGDIVVLCAYLGQLARLRDALGNEVAVVIDERDQAALDDHEGDKDDSGDSQVGARVDHIKVTKRVRLRTVDNYQGEEGRIVILSLVRNSGGSEDEMGRQTISQTTRVNIGFLKSENRTNVAISRAREGLYIFGNAENLSARSKMWRNIIEELESQDALGPALPVVCHRHRDKIEYISRPGQLSRIAPDGGCMEQCDTLLKCGHLCPFKCHCDDPNHVAVVCTKPCRRLCHRDHPCQKVCNTPCGDCLFPVHNVRLPCGHVKDSVPCYQLDVLDSVQCNEAVVKQLPRCEHQGTLPCYVNPEDHRCLARCAGLMPCCGKSCSGSCHGCQSINPTPANAHRATRSKHVAHPCQKRLYCEHDCQEPCSEDHEHTTRCTYSCRQICSHAQCRRGCSVPCAPCKQPCTWSCPHYSCPVPCGSVCARLPCDRRCDKLLACGHRCPSVCGEDCAIQFCPQCASEDQSSQVADFIMQRTLAEINPDLESVDELLITIPSCRHTFTVETLDGHCNMTEFYEVGQDGRWRGLLSPIGYKRPPTCPTCRSEITAPRYGRVFKRANLDILERNVAAQMSRSLGRIQTSVEALQVASKKEHLVNAAASIDLKFKDKMDKKTRQTQAQAREQALNVSKQVPVSDRDISPGNKKLHAFHSSVLDVWRTTMHELFTAYREAVQVTETRSAHTEAWEAALSYLYEGELNASLIDLRTIPKEPTVHAMRVAKMKIGQLRPLADKRFLVEAFWSTIHIRLTIIDLATTWLEEISKRIPDNKIGQQQLTWANYVLFLFKSCLRDVEIASNVAKDSESHRQISKTALYHMRVSLEEFRFDLMMCKMTGTFKTQEQRDILAEHARDRLHKAKECMELTVQRHCEKKPDLEEREWLEKNFTNIALDIVEEWTTIESSIRMDTFYEPVSLAERMQIVTALGFAHAGHWYNCPNGHTFVITECGGAMQVSRCPECNARIGGSGHHLDPSNTRSAEFEELARQAGAPPTPWGAPW